MQEVEFMSGLLELQELSKGDYRQTLGDLLSEGDDRTAFNRLGRLIGVSLKQPFATPTVLRSKYDSHSRSYRAWELKPGSFDKPELRGTWQYRTLEAIRVEAPPAFAFHSVEALAIDAHHESGFFGYLARSAQKYICGDPTSRSSLTLFSKMN